MQAARAEYRVRITLLIKKWQIGQPRARHFSFRGRSSCCDWSCKISSKTVEGKNVKLLPTGQSNRLWNEKWIDKSSSERISSQYLVADSAWDLDLFWRKNLFFLSFPAYGRHSKMRENRAFDAVIHHELPRAPRFKVTTTKIFQCYHHDFYKILSTKERETHFTQPK